MKSLLDILTKEKELVDRFKRQKDAIHVYEEQLERIRGIDVDCKIKEDDMNRYKILIEENERAILMTKRKIDGVRLEIRKYFKELQKVSHYGET